MKIGDVARELGIPTSTIRYYEQVGLLEPQRRVSGRRAIDDLAVLTLRFIQLAQAAGFSIAEMRTLQDDYSADPHAGRMWRTLAGEKRSAVRAQITALKRMDRVLSEMLKCECTSLEACVEDAVGDGRGPKRTR